MEIPKQYDPKQTEKKWQLYWEKNKIHSFDPKSKKEVYSVDTPPPTVSGRMHLGHAFSYAQQDFIVRFHRMLGKNVFYPWGFDDNGLPSERFVEKKLNIKATEMLREEFRKICLKETTKIEEELKKSWQALGISPDWSYNYRTINKDVMRKSQISFIELYEMGREYRKRAPIIWCPECQTAIAQVELEDKERNSNFIYIKFDTEDGEKITIATTRPELMAACVAVFVHPDDKRYKHLVGKKVKIPFFNHKVKVYANEAADPEFGSGIVYHCTFGDADDIEWVEKYNLPVIEMMNKDGTLNEKAGKYAGMRSAEARAAITEDLKKDGRIEKIEPIKHVVNVHERCGTDIEFIMTDQWYIKYLDLKDKFLKAGRKIKWYPKFMRIRYDHWVKGLKWDWCISRQRYFGVPFPVWYCKKCNEIILADKNDLPVDPLADKPKKPCKCGSTEFIPEKDILDTWATSSLTPQIALKWREDDKFFKKMFPMNLRPQAHDIITFWAFNTVVKSLLHENDIPWKDIVISGHALDSKGKKMSKSKGNIINPLEMIDKYSADSLRFWAAGSKLGDDLPFQEKDLVTGQKFVTKLWNAAKFSLMHLKDYKGNKPKNITGIDKWILSKLNHLIKISTDSFMKYEYYKTKLETEKFFWHVFADNYLEIVKDRLYNSKNYTKEAVLSAKYTLYTTIITCLKLIAPILPHITEEIYHFYFNKIDGAKSIHLSEWPKYDKKLVSKEKEEIGDIAVEIISAVRKFKSGKNLSLKVPVRVLTIECKKPVQEKIKKLEQDIKGVTNTEKMEFGKGTVKINKDLKIKIEL